MEVYTLSGKMLLLREPYLGSGGEGNIYEIVGFSNKVAKIYHSKAEARERESKILEMVKISEGEKFKKSNISQSIAWPLSPLYDKYHDFIGFGMNKVDSNYELGDLYVYPPKNGNMHVANKIKCLISLCDVIAKLHQLGQVFGDFNPNNIKIKRDWTINFVDADSYHVKNGGKVYKCNVCAPGYVAPEIIRKCKGITYAEYPGVTFTPESDNFALAIHCFRMLMNGCHPFSCQRYVKPIGSAPSPRSIDQRVERGETPFFVNVKDFKAPEFASDMKCQPPYIQDLFKRAFVDGHRNPKARPDASEWKKALIRYRQELKQCKRNKFHWYWKNSSTCPYCKADENNRKSMLATVGTTQNVNSLVASNNTASPNYKNAASASVKKSRVILWIVSMIFSAVCQLLLGHYVLPEIYSFLMEKEWFIMLGTIGSMICGMIGTGVYNSSWASCWKYGKTAFYDYLLSILTGVAFSGGFIIFVIIVMIAVYILMYILGIIGLLMLLIGLCSG